MMQVVRLDDYRPPASKRVKQKRVKQKSQYELYPMPFFNRKERCTWDVTPTGDYTVDCETGQAFAIEFLKSSDKSCGWASLMQQIVADMIRAGPNGAFPGGRPMVNGVVVGFMGVIGGAVAHSRVLDRL
jgi:hypothetical protein